MPYQSLPPVILIGVGIAAMAYIPYYTQNSARMKKKTWFNEKFRKHMNVRDVALDEKYVKILLNEIPVERPEINEELNQLLVETYTKSSSRQ